MTAATTPRLAAAAPSSFAPSADKTKAALVGRVPITNQVHPGGTAGVKLSLDEVCKRIKAGKDDPLLVAWARRAVAGSDPMNAPQTTRGRAQAILDQLHREVTYIPDPVNGEFMAQPRHLLCLEGSANGLCMKGGDCDELVILYASACLAVGVPTQVVGECFNGDKDPSHVLCAILDTETNEWLHVDPSTPKPVGEWVEGTKEIWIDPLEDKALSLGAPVTGTFVGVGRVGGHVGLGTPPAAPAPSNTGWMLAGLAIAAAGLYFVLKPAGGDRLRALRAAGNDDPRAWNRVPNVVRDDLVRERLVWWRSGRPHLTPRGRRELVTMLADEVA